MPTRFKHNLPLSPDEVDFIWKEGVIILDTNIWLHMYRFPEEKSNNLLDILQSEAITPRLWVPYQVAEEFFRNRTTVIADQITAMNKTQAYIQAHMDAMYKEIPSLVRKYHPLLDRDEWERKFRKTFASLQTSLRHKQEAYPISPDSDPLLDRAIEIMTGRIGDAFPETERATLEAEAKKRFDAEIPPGFKDKKKGETQRAMGDFLVWKQILVEMKKRNSHAILVTDDEKEDWWVISQGHHLGALPALRKEFTDSTGHNFLLCSSQRFLEWANAQIATPLSPSDLEELEESFREAADSENEPPYTHFDYDSPDEVSIQDILDWFYANYKDPADGVPYDSGEGGYQYWNGGPYSASDAIWYEFSDVPEAVIEEAVNRIHDDGWEWVGQHQY